MFMRYFALLTITILCLPIGLPNSIVLYLANVASEASNVELEHSLRALYAVFLSRHPQYPVVVTYDANDQHHLTKKLRLRLVEQINGTEVSFVHAFAKRDGPALAFVPVYGFRRVSWPFSMYTDVYREENPYYSRVGYRHMCQYWAYKVFGQWFMQKNVTSYMRLDTDTNLVEMPVDPFSLLQRENISYLSSVSYKESRDTTHGLWETMLRFAERERSHPWGLAPLSNAGKDMHSTEDIRRMDLRDAAWVLYRRGYNLNYMYNNWEVSRVDVWQSEVYQRLAEFLDSSGGIILRRWGDAPIRTLSLHLLREQIVSGLSSSSSMCNTAPFREYRGLAVHHKALHRTHGTEL